MLYGAYVWYKSLESDFWKNAKYIQISAPLIKGNDKVANKYFRNIRGDSKNNKNLWRDDVDWDN